MSKEGSMVDPDEAQKEEEINKIAQTKMANALEGLAKVVSGIGITLVAVKGAIDANTKQLKDTADRLNSLVTLLAVGKRINGEPEIDQKIVQAKPAGPEPPTPQPLPSTPEPEKESYENKVKMLFPQELETLLTFEDKGDYIQIKPRQFLGSENFAKIASVVRAVNGEYVSAGKDSHFRIFRKKQ